MFLLILLTQRNEAKTINLSLSLSLSSIKRRHIIKTNMKKMFTCQTHTNKRKQKPIVVIISKISCRYLKSPNEAFFNGSYPKQARKLGGREMLQSKKMLTATNNICVVGLIKGKLAARQRQRPRATTTTPEEIFSKIHKFIIYHI